VESNRKLKHKKRTSQNRSTGGIDALLSALSIKQLEDETAAPLHLHPKRVDYVLVGDHFPFNAPSAPGAAPGDGTGKVLHCELVGPNPITGTNPSDHHGVFALVAWPQVGPRE
jgi:hypothetical protein